jgi:hypothetical protein
MTMSAGSAKSTALGCVIGAGAIASVKPITSGQLPPLRIGVGVFVAGAMLLALADASPSLAAGFGALVLLGAVLKDGVPAAQQLSKSISVPPVTG